MMTTIIDVEAIYRHEKTRWLKEEAPRRSIRELIATSVPYWIVVVAVVLYGLSAPHTAGVFDKLTPGYGFIAPVGVEFGLLYAAFRRRLAKDEKKSLPWTLWALEILLFVTAVLVNGTGAFVSVVEATGINNLSFAAIIEKFGTLPATSQAALVMAVLSAFIIPIGALVAGEGFAAILLERREGTDYREQRWIEVEFKVIYRAVFVRYLQQGIGDKEAKQKALAEVRGYLASVSNPSGVRLLSAPSEQGERTAQDKSDGIKAKVRAYINEHPEIAEMSISQALSTIKTAGIEVGRTTVAELLAERKNKATA